MRPTVKDTPRYGSIRWGGLPQHMRVLFVTTPVRTGGWLTEALAADSASEVVIEEACGFTAGLSRLRDEIFDAVLISHEPCALNAADLVQALRAGGSEEPLVVLGVQGEHEMTALCLEANADGYLCVQNTTTRTLIWVLARAIERHQMLRENRRLLQAERSRVDTEHNEAARLIGAQRSLVRDLAARNHQGLRQPQQPKPLPSQLESYYRELLRTHVVMGLGNMAAEMQSLAELMVGGGVTAAQALEMHACALEALLKGLGNRSARHVMHRADLLALEIVGQLCEAYRQRMAE